MTESVGAADALLAEARASTDARLAALGREMEATVPAPLGSALAYALGTSGKRVRPALVMASYRAAGGAPRPGIHRLATAVEIIHTYSLVHDDLPCMDDDDQRRGRPTTHVAFDPTTAARVGFLLVPVAAEELSRATTELDLPASTRQGIARGLLDASGIRGMVGGQWLDLAAEGRQLGPEDLEGIHLRKTAALIRAACVVGGMAAGASGPALEALAGFGLEIGLAFQVADDVLDATATTAELGKTAGRDRSRGKSTYVSVYGVERAREVAAACATRAVGRLTHSGLSSTSLQSLAGYIVERRS
jgi:geranylgeranyl pyrophosphate synthase